MERPIWAIKNKEVMHLMDASEAFRTRVYKANSSKLGLKRSLEIEKLINEAKDWHKDNNP